jgi:2-succinyl-5-enolpyruvyl-6-hydroxy-3-cyclohexene-1-carboxylate synthase
MTRDANTAFARTLVDEFVRAGVRHACVAPGSRSAPLALALVGDGRLRVHVHLDERSAAFFALGCARASGQPAVVCCTSGTAAAHLHPAVLEAAHGRVPMLVCTADRPPELRDTGAGQTIDQVGLYGEATRWSVDVEAPADRAGIGTWWRSLAARAVACALGPPAGPVHLNLAFRDPLGPTGADPVTTPGRPDGRSWTTTERAERRVDERTVARLAQEIRRVDRGLVVAGWGAAVSGPVADGFARATGWPILADPLSGLRAGDHAIAAYDALLRVEEFAETHCPDLVLRIGGPPTSATAQRWLNRGRSWLVDPDDSWLDPGHTASVRVCSDAEPALRDLTAALPEPGPSPAWSDDWRAADRCARNAINGHLDSSEDPFEGRVARDVLSAIPDSTTLVVASSMPVRDLDSFGEARSGVRIIANRGVNGIDGLVSTTLGASAAGPGPTVALTGDLSFLHDSNGLLGAEQRGLNATFVVVDNDGGGIFSFLPYSETVPSERFERMFATPPGVDVADVARAHGVAFEDIEKASALEPALRRAVETGGVRVVRVRTDRAANAARHAEVWDAVRVALAAR